MKLKVSDFSMVPMLMNSFMDLESQSMIFHLIEDLLIFKEFITNYIAIRNNELVGHLEGCCFKFYMHKNGWPIMHYKFYCTNSKWLPIKND